ncbi:MAG TPA: ATP-binding protein [Candidatus Dormibacteraeota bacterium]|nr:ATP-binding protein [Candidatus Dormibacteraeota bacterium]
MKDVKDNYAETSHDLATSYTTALAEYLAKAGEDTLRRAYEIGRQAITQGIGVLEMAKLHHEALATALLRNGHARDSLAADLQRAEEFFTESFSPYEMTHRGFRESVIALRNLNETLELEIQRIAHAVHDEAGQLLVAARLAISELAHEVRPALAKRLLEIMDIFDQVEEQLRRLSHELRPTILDDLGLVPALRFLADGVAKRSKILIKVESSLAGRPPTSIETAVYRIIQEALNNVTKHSQAKNVTIQLNRDGRNLHCAIRDDGQGFDVPAVLARKGQKGLGLIGIRERLNAVGGTLQLQSERSYGTELLVTIPMEN